MPETLSSNYVTKKNLLQSGDGWAWLIEIQYDASTAFRITSHDADISHGGHTWSPFRVQVAAVAKDGEGVLPEFDLTVGNISREFGQAIEAGYLLDREVRIMLINVGVSYDEASSSNQVHLVTFTVIGASVSYEEATLHLGKPNLNEAPFPSQRYVRSKCRWVFGGAGCGFDTSLTYQTPTSYPNFDSTTCDYGLATANGCRAHGAAQDASGLPVLHPKRFGGFKDIPRGRARSG